MVEINKVNRLLDQAVETSVEIRKQIENMSPSDRRKRTSNLGFTNQYEIDVLADEIVHDHLSDFEGYILSEEREVSKKDVEGNDFIFVIDPIDGSTNAAHSVGYWCFSAALLYKGEVVGAVVVDQVNHRIFRATLDNVVSLKNKQGLQLDLTNQSNDHEDVGTRADNFSSAVICFTTHEGPSIPFRHFRHFGASALSICEVAAGFIDAYIDDEDILLKPWDLLAAEFIAKKAGCTVIRRDSDGLLAATGVFVTHSETLVEAFKDIFPNFFNN